jgi:hypothetical protein
MGFTIYYRCTRQLTAAEAEAIRQGARQANRGRTWLSCEAVHFFAGLDEGQLVGGSKPNFTPHPDDVASARRTQLPDGDVRAMIDVLCQLSRHHRVDWEFSHDYDRGPIGYIRDGVCEADLATQIEAFAALPAILAEALDDPREGL